MTGALPWSETQKWLVRSALSVLLDRDTPEAAQEVVEAVVAEVLDGKVSTPYPRPSTEGPVQMRRVLHFVRTKYDRNYRHYGRWMATRAHDGKRHDVGPEDVDSLEKKNPGLTRAEMAQILGCSARHVGRVQNALDLGTDPYTARTRLEKHPRVETPQAWYERTGRGKASHWNFLLPAQRHQVRLAYRKRMQ